MGTRGGGQGAGGGAGGDTVGGGRAVEYLLQVSGESCVLATPLGTSRSQGRRACVGSQRRSLAVLVPPAVPPSLAAAAPSPAPPVSTLGSDKPPAPPPRRRCSALRPPFATETFQRPLFSGIQWRTGGGARLLRGAWPSSASARPGLVTVDPPVRTERGHKLHGSRRGECMPGRGANFSGRGAWRWP